MSNCGISQIFVQRDVHRSPQSRHPKRMFGVLPHGKSYADRLVNAMANGYLIAVLESICAREMQTHLDHNEETLVVSSMQCQHRAPIPPGALVRINGWVTGVADQEATSASSERRAGDRLRRTDSPYDCAAFANEKRSSASAKRSAPRVVCVSLTRLPLADLPTRHGESGSTTGHAKARRHLSRSMARQDVRLASMYRFYTQRVSRRSRNHMGFEYTTCSTTSPDCMTPRTAYA